MKQKPVRRATALVTALVLLAAPLPLVAQPSTVQPTQPVAVQPVCPLPLVPLGTDNRDGYLVNLEEPPVDPLMITDDKRELWAVNLPDSRVEVWDIQMPRSPRSIAEVAVCLGPVAIASKPVVSGSGARAEVWGVCHSSNAIFVIDQVTKLLIDMISVKQEPAGLVFSADGSKAYVSASSSNQVIEIDTATRQPTATMEVQSTYPVTGGLDLHVEEPTAMVLQGNDLYVLSNQSGNGTLAVAGQIAQGWSTGVPPPDRDVIKLDVTSPMTTGSAEAWRMGTINFDVEMDGGGNLLVSSVDLLNDQVIGEEAHNQNGFTRHQITIAAPTGGSPNLPGITTVDLNGANAAGMPDDYACDTPNEMVLNANGSQLFVGCYGTSNVVRLDMTSSPPKVIQELRATPVISRFGAFGTRGLAFLESAQTLYAYERGNQSLSIYDTSAGGALVTAVANVPIGYNAESGMVRAGRFHNINARNSADGTRSCNSCHTDGRLDRIAWELGAFTGNLGLDPNDEVQDDKALMVTLSLIGIEETPPLHWRGDREDLPDFNGAFAGLLGGRKLTAREMDEYLAFVFSLSYPPNPKQNENRVYSGQAQSGHGCFIGPDAHDLTDDNVGTLVRHSCAACHSLDGFSGTNNQINNDVANDPNPHDVDGFPANPQLILDEDATQLRGLFDKKSDIANVGGFTFPVSGYGFGHNHITNTVEQFVDLGVFNLLSQPQRDDIKRLLLELDSGLAPSTAEIAALNPRTLAGFNATNLINGAAAGHNDLIVRGWFVNGGVPTPINLLYAPSSGLFIPDTFSLPAMPLSTLQAAVSGGVGEFYFIGTPVASGIRLALDRDMDAAIDGDEATNGASTRSSDTDGDGYPDGYEIRLGSLPNNPASTPPAENVAPNIQNATVAWVESEVGKVRWTTDEESRSRVRVKDPSTGTTLWVGQESAFKFQHSMVFRGIDPSGTYDIEIESEDPFIGIAGGNKQTFTISNVVTQPHLFLSVHIEKADIPTILGSGASRQAVVDFTVHDEAKNPVQGAKVRFRLVEWVPGTAGTTVSATFVTGTSNLSGVATATVPIQSTGPITIEAIGDEVTDLATARQHFNPLSGELGFWFRRTVP